MKQRLTDNVSLVAQSPRLDHAAIEVVVTLPTFKRPDHLLLTLDSLRQQKTNRRFAIVVIENEAEAREGALAASPKFEDGTYQGAVIVAHERGNCHAYNAGWFTALTHFPNFQYLCVLDDDEIADPDWIEAACSTAQKLGVDLVGGPQVPVFDRAPVENWKSHPVFKPHYQETGPVPRLYSSGNLTISRKVLSNMPQPFLDLAFNFTGGGDTDFIARALERGFRTAWAAEAIVRETVPENRVSWDWIQKRALRNGELSARIEHRTRARQGTGYWRTWMHTGVLALAAPLRFLVGLARTGSLLNALYPVHIALGRIMSEFGYKNEQYRNPRD